ERVVDARPGPEVALEEHLHELRDELAEVRMEAVDVLRPFDLRKLRLRPRELEVDLAVELALRGRHEKVFDGDPAVACVRSARAELRPLAGARGREVVEAEADRRAAAGRVHEALYLRWRRGSGDASDRVDGQRRVGGRRAEQLDVRRRVGLAPARIAG